MFRSDLGSIDCTRDFYFILFLIHPKVGLKYNRTISTLQGIYTHFADFSLVSEFGRGARFLNIGPLIII